MFAIIRTGGKQYKVAEKQTIHVEKLPESARAKGKVVFSDVLLVSNEDSVTIGTPLVTKATVEASVVKDGRGEKIRVVKYKAKTRYKRVTGHRQPFTEIRIEKIIA